MNIEDEEFSLIEPGEIGSDPQYKEYPVETNIVKVPVAEALKNPDSGDPIPTDPRKPKP